MTPKIGYIDISRFKTNKEKLCETPKHKNLKFKASGVIALQSDDYPDGLIMMVCEQCWKKFDYDMNSPQWNLIEIEEETKNDR